MINYILTITYFGGSLGSYKVKANSTNDAVRKFLDSGTVQGFRSITISELMEEEIQ